MSPHQRMSSNRAIFKFPSGTTYRQSQSNKLTYSNFQTEPKLYFFPLSLPIFDSYHAHVVFILSYSVLIIPFYSTFLFFFPLSHLQKYILPLFLFPLFILSRNNISSSFKHCSDWTVNSPQRKDRTGRGSWAGSIAAEELPVSTT